MIFYKTGYTRIPRVVNITGAYKYWNNETQSFESASSEYLKKNQLLLELKEKYMSVAERWEKDGRNFSVLQWADCFKPKEEEKAKQESKVLTVLQLINARIEYCENHEKFKNGKLVKSVGTAGMYKQFRTSLSAFTLKQYNKDLSRFYFTDITQKFLLEYIVYLGRRGSFSSLVSETLDKVCEILGIDEKMTWYTARGTFISSELDVGTPITHVAEMAGNSARTIEKHYYKNTKQEEVPSA